MIKFHSTFWLIIVFALFSVTSVQAQRVIKVLAVGNSFSEDAVEQNLYELARAEGDSLVIGNAYIGGCSIDRHWGNAQTGKTEYAYRKIIGGIKHSQKNVSLSSIIKDEDWDIITVQQCSPLSGMRNSYENLNNLLNYIQQTATNSQVRFLFHMTWAYAQNSTHQAFSNYNKDQMTMYHSILKTVKGVCKQLHLPVIPCGTAIQNARTILGDNLCRDGYHLSLTEGRYVAACTWCAFLTGKKVSGNSYHPASISAREASIAQTAADYAMRKPYKISFISDTTNK